jgi:hypothetical protein
VHDARTRQRRGAGMMRQQAVEQGAAPVSRRRVHHQTGRFVHHHEVLVLVHHRERHGLRAKRQALRGGHQPDLDPLCGLEPARRRGDHLIVHTHLAIGNQLLHVAARKLRHPLRCGTVQPRAVVLGGGPHHAGLDLPLARLGRQLGPGVICRPLRCVVTHAANRAVVIGTWRRKVVVKRMHSCAPYTAHRKQRVDAARSCTRLRACRDCPSFIIT